MDDHSVAYVALDTSKLRNAVAIAEAGRNGEIRYLGEIDNAPAATAKLARRLARKHAALTFAYEAGPTGYGLYRQIKSLGHDCIVVAPSLIPQKPGDRVKTNRRDALSLARQLRAGDLTAVWVPDPHHEAVRDLTRARGAAVRDQRAKRQQVSALLLRLGLHYPGKTTWGKAHMAWLAGQKLAHLEQRIAACGAPGRRPHRAVGTGDPRSGAGLVARAVGHRADGAARHRVHRRHHVAGGDRRSDTVPHAARADGLAGHGAE